MRDGFILHEENMEDIAELSNEEKGVLLTAIIAHYYGEETEIEEPLTKVIAKAICRRMDRDAGLYELKSGAGKQGGRGNIKQTESKKKQTESKKKQTESPVPVPVPVPDPVPDTVSPSVVPPRGRYDPDPELDDAITRFLKFRKEQHGFRFKSKDSFAQWIKHLYELGETTEERIAIINQSIANGWQGIFPLKNRSGASGPHQQRDEGKEYLLRLARGEES